MEINRPSDKEFKLGLILNYIATAVGLIASLALNPIIIKNLGQSEYGLFETIGSFVNYLAILDLGFSGVVVRYTAKYQAEGRIDKRDEFLFIARRVYTILSITVLIIGAVLYQFIDIAFENSFSPDELIKARYMFGVVLVTTALTIYGQVYSGTMTGIEKFIFPRVIRIAKTIFSKLVAILIIKLGSDSVGYTVVLFLFEAISFLINRYYCNKHVDFKKCKIIFSEIKELLVFTSYLTLHVLTVQLYWQADKVVLGSMLGTTVVAIYSIALTLQSIIGNLSASIKDILLPKATQIAVSQSKPGVVQDFMVRAGRMIFIVYGIALVGLTLFGKQFLTLWLGSEYEFSYFIFLILGYSNLGANILNVGETVCKAYNKYRFISITSLVAAVINVIMTVLFVKSWGMIGAAVATGIGLLIGSTIIPLMYYKKIFKLQITKFWRDIFSGTIVCLLISAAIGHGLNKVLTETTWISLGIKSITVCIVYVTGMLLFGFTNNEKEKILSIKRG